MASKALKRFVGGFALTTLDQIQKREAYQRELEKAEMLERLRAETAKDLADYQELLDAKKPSKEQSTSDFETGKKTLRNQYGEKIGEIDLPASDKFAYEQEKRKASLDEENIRSQIADRARDSANAERQTSAYIKSLDQQTGVGGTKPTGSNGKLSITDRANEIKYRQQDVVKDLIASGVPADAVQQTILRSLKNAAARGLPPSAAEEFFINAAEQLRQAFQPGGMSANRNTRKTNKSLDKSVRDGDEDN